MFAFTFTLRFVHRTSLQLNRTTYSVIHLGHNVNGDEVGSNITCRKVGLSLIMANSIEPPVKFQEHGGPPPMAWKEWNRMFDTYMMDAIDSEQFTDKRKTALLLHSLGASKISNRIQSCPK